MNSSNAGKSDRNWIIAAALLALFLGALDSLIMSAAMPTIISELGGLHLYAWTYTAYFLFRAVSLPIFGKLSDMVSTRNLFLFAITLFLLSSVAAGISPSMKFLIAARAFQGIGSGGIFGLVYIVLSEASTTEERARTLSFASAVWGIASLIGPTLGGFLVTWLSWRWIFFINIPLGIVSVYGIARYFEEFREKTADRKFDWPGAALLSISILGFLALISTGNRELPVTSMPFLVLAAVTIISGILCVRVEMRAENPMLNLRFFRHPSYAMGNALVFSASFVIFSLFAYAPIFLQGALSRTPLEVGYAMLALSLGWSVSSLWAGRNMHRMGHKNATLLGTALLVAGTGMTLGFSRTTGMPECFLVFCMVGFGMGFVSLTTLLIVQTGVGPADLGVATSFHQFSRTIGGAIGVGLCGGIVTNKLIDNLQVELRIAGQGLPEKLIGMLQESMANMFQKEFQAMIPPGMEAVLQDAVLNGVYLTFVIVFIVSVLNLGLALALPKDA